MRDVADRHPAVRDARRARLHRHHADRAGHRRRTGRTTSTTCTSSTRCRTRSAWRRRSSSSATRRRRGPTSRSATTRPATGTTGRRSSPRCTRCTTAPIGHTVEIPLQVNRADYDDAAGRGAAPPVGGQHRRRRGDHPRRHRLRRRPTGPACSPTRSSCSAAAGPASRQPADPGRVRRRASARRTGTRTTFPRAYVIPAGAGQRSPAGRRPAGRPPGRPRRAGHQGPVLTSGSTGRVYRGRLVRGGHAPAQARPGQRDAGGRAGTSPTWSRRCTTSPAGATACCGARPSTSARPPLPRVITAPVSGGRADRLRCPPPRPRPAC